MAKILLHARVCVCVLWCSLFSCPVMSVFLQPHGLQHTRPPWTSPSPGICPSSCPLNWWSNHLILCCSLILLLSIFASIRVFSNESTLQIRWPEYWSFSFSLSPSDEYSDWFPLGLTGWISLLSKDSMYCERRGWHNSIPSKETFSIFKYLSYLATYFLLLS